MTLLGLLGVLLAVGATAGPGTLLVRRTATAPHDSDLRPVPRVQTPGRLRHTLDVPLPPHSEWITVGGTVVLSLIAAALVALLVAAFVQRRRRGPSRPEEDEPLPDLAEAVSRAAGSQRLALLDGEPRNAVVACWERFEVAAADAGVERQPWETPTEFTLRLLDLVHARPGAVDRLAALYREARFSTHPVTEDHRLAALAALDEIHAGLTLVTR